MKKGFLKISFIALLSIVFFSVPTISLAQLPLPSALVTTKAATNIGPSYATLNGSYNTEVKSVWFKYGTDSNNLDKNTSEQTFLLPIAIPGGINNYGEVVTGLTSEPLTKYYFKFCGKKEGQSEGECGSILNFTTTSALTMQDQGEGGWAAAGGDWCVVEKVGGKNQCIAGGERYKTEEDCIASLGKNEAKKTCSQFYTLLAPLPGMGTEVETAGGEETRANYFNLIVKFLIGIAGVLAVIMIVIGGFQYMLSDIPFSKAEAKGRIWGAIGGLTLALGAFLILQILDPQILNLGIGKLKKAELTVQEDAPMSSSTEGKCSVGSKVGKCLNVVNVKGFLICETYAEKFEALINKASKAGYELTGGSCRTKEAQIALRKQNCKGYDVYDIKAKCDPSTATPGSSRHENAAAVDFKCNGKFINIEKNPDTKLCFEWLKANLQDSPIYEFKKNYWKENWHWSVDGH